MKTFLFVEQSPNPLAIKLVYKEPFLKEGSLTFYKEDKPIQKWLEPLWTLNYIQQIYIAQNFIVLIHQPLEKKLDSHLSLWAEKLPEIQNILQQITFPNSLQQTLSQCAQSDLKAIQQWLDTVIKKATWIHGGEFKAIKIENHILFLRPEGACYQCPYLGMTIYKGILRPLSLQFPQIQNIQLSYDDNSVN